ncbi:hypothetical protein CLM_1142 [Clostridium botulinum A2 str. Kyoto]|uniref:Uncharacterized protein n=1 Tax=Clostridium botulinum (strain Kyoto / Type A2) TaxID=536232 RepID=C1FVI9_CLOBJ|nr:hypothetical protein CLM_1142 [Clostridium botulinum A2 str. Kyoto]
MVVVAYVIAIIFQYLEEYFYICRIFVYSPFNSLSNLS